MDIELFKKLLAEGKQDHAQTLLEEHLAGLVSAREQGDVLLAMAAAYIDSENAINEEYVRILQNALAELSTMQKQHSKLSDHISLIKTRKQLD